MVSASAPGKLVICGEYAVLDGATALVAAVTSRARAHIRLIDADYSEFEHPVSGAALRYRADRAGKLSWLGDDPLEWGDILSAVLATASADFSVARLPAMQVRIDTSDFFIDDANGHSKLGLGSSAAATVALCRALIGALDMELSLAGLERFSRAAHSRVQRGRGSGVDVLAAIYGGVIAAERAADCRPVSWPAGFHAVPVWSGRPASSAELIGRYEAYRGRDADSARHLAQLREVAAKAVVAWCAADIGGIVAALGEYDEALVSLDQDANIGIYTRVHERLRGIATGAGARYKVSGAGGGDFGLAFCDSRAVAQAAREAFTAAGFAVLDAALAAPGVAVSFD